MRTSRVVLACGVFLFLTSCVSSKESLFVLQSDKRSLFVLQTDSDGRTGQIVVRNKAGSQLLSRAGDATEVKDGNTPPSAAFRLEEAQIAKTFGSALAAQPPAPVLYLLHFRTGSTDLVAGSEQLLAKILESSKARQSTDIRVVGHTDRVGKREGNYTLGLERAQEVKRILVSRGIDPDIIEVESHGEDNQLIPTPNEVPESRNRRVEVTVR